MTIHEANREGCPYNIIKITPAIARYFLSQKSTMTFRPGIHISVAIHAKKNMQSMSIKEENLFLSSLRKRDFEIVFYHTILFLNYWQDISDQ